MESDEEFPKGLRVFCLIVGILIIFFVSALIKRSLDWEWVEIKKGFWGYETHDWRWLKYIFYPATAIGEALGLLIATLSLPKGVSKAMILLGVIVAFFAGALITWAYNWDISSGLVPFKYFVIFILGAIGIAALYGSYALLTELKSKQSKSPKPNAPNPNAVNQNAGYYNAPASEWNQATPQADLVRRTAPEELKRIQLSIKDIVSDIELYKVVRFLKAECAKYAEYEKIDGLTRPAFDGMTDYYQRTQLEIIRGLSVEKRQKIVGEILLLITRLDSYHGKADESMLLLRRCNEFVEVSRPLILRHPDTMVLDVPISELVESVKALVVEKRAGKRQEDSFEALLHK